jgi:hypothetical protein
MLTGSVPDSLSSSIHPLEDSGTFSARSRYSSGDDAWTIAVDIEGHSGSRSTLGSNNSDGERYRNEFDSGSVQVHLKIERLGQDGCIGHSSLERR